MSEGPAPDIDEVVRLDFEVDPALTMAELRRGRRDPTVRFEPGVVWRASSTTDGPVTTRISRAAGGWRVMAWGPGSATALEGIPRLLGAEDDPAGLELPPGRLRDLAVRLSGLRFGRTDAVWPALLPSICGQKVTAVQAHRSYFGIVRRYGRAAPGPGRLRLVPEPEVIAALPYYELHPLGLEQRRAATLVRVAQQTERLQDATAMTPGAALARLRSVPGLGEWTAAEVARQAFGNPDAVSLGDFHIPSMVCWALAAEPRGDDTRMLELLEPYRGQRARVVRLVEGSGISAPKYGPRMRIRPIDGM